MKRIISSILVCCVLAAVLACQVFAAAPVVKLTPGVSEAKPGDTVTVTVSAETDTDLHGFQMDIGYDATVLEYKGAQFQVPGTWYSEIALVGGEGNLRLLTYDDTDELSAPVTGTPGLCLITFQVKEGAADGTADIGLKDLLTAGADGNLVADAAGMGTAVEIKKEGGASTDKPPVTTSKPTTTKKPSIPGGAGGSVTITADTGKKPNPGTSDTMLLIGSLAVLAGAGGTAVFLINRKKKK